MDTPRATTRNRWIDPADLHQIWKAAPEKDRFLFTTLAYTGFRVEDIAASKRLDWDWINHTVTIRERKTGKVRTVKMDTLTQASAYCTEMEGYWRKPFSEWFLPSRRPKNSGHISRATIWRAWKRAIRAAGLEGKGYTIHSLRKAYAVELFKRTGSLEAVQRDLNHERIGTTLIYLQDYFSSLARPNG